MATVFIHIGTPKTATSTLQNVFASKYKALLKDGVLYPRTFRSGDAHHVLVCDLIEKYQRIRMPDVWYGQWPRGQAWAALTAEIASHGSNIHSVVLSSELFFGQSNSIKTMLDEVVEQLHGHEVRIITYLRRQDQLYSSFYNQDVKGARQWTGSAYQFYQTHQIFQQDYCSVLGIWSGVFGKKHMIIRPFESEQWPDGDIVRDFCAAIGIAPLRGTYKHQNESLGTTQLYIKRCINKIGFDKKHNEEVLRVLRHVCPESPAKVDSYVHRALYRQYRLDWLRVNRAISADYLDGADLFKRDMPSPEDLEIYRIDKYRVAGYIQNMVRIFKKGEYAEQRALFTRATLLAMAEQNLWHALETSDQQLMLSWI